MLTRALLRTKAAQVLYANFQSHSDINVLDNELNFSIQKSYDLYYLLLLLPVEISKLAKKKIEDASQKILKTDNDRVTEFNGKLANNLFVNILVSNKQLLNCPKGCVMFWQQYNEELKNIYSKLSETDFFKHYIKDTDSSFDEDRQFWRKFYRSKRIFDDRFYSFLEETSIYWLDDLGIALSFAEKTIKNFSDTDFENNALFSLYKDDSDREFIINLTHNVYLKSKEYDELISSYLKDWALNRITIMDIVLLKMAVAEFKLFPFIPKNVTINEYVEISKYYGTDKSSSFINGVLDKIAKTIEKPNF
ncbi:MAG: transcription antitermination factor NusB [Prevotellaceae bacterium]|jgi:N utilization substance protein B|nr:transcription antitermination factor NusB [Prevotellaceae bacterium]